MALIVADRVIETTTTTGTGALALAGAVSGFRDFDSVCANNDTCYYSLYAVDANGNPSGDWECGLATFTDVDTLTRTTVHASSNAGAAVNLAAGTKRVQLDATATYLASRAAWALAGTGQTATGVYDFAVDGAKANIDFADLGSFNELMVVARGLSDGTTGLRVLRVSTDNGATFYATNGDYVVVNVDGTETATTIFDGHGTNSTAARSFVTHIVNTKGVVKLNPLNGTANSGTKILFVASASDINAVRVTNNGGGNITAGTVRVYAR